MIQESQERVVSLTKALRQTEQKLQTLRRKIQDNRLTGRKSYKKLQRNSAAEEEISATAVEPAETVVSNEIKAAGAIIDETHATEQKLATQVHTKVACVSCILIMRLDLTSRMHKVMA